MPPTVPDRPVGLGASISHVRGGPGSMGLVVGRREEIGWFLLSACHILAPAGAETGDAVVQPAVSHAGTEPIALLVDHEPLQGGEGVNRFDAAVARIINSEDVVPRVPVIGEVRRPVIRARLFASVRKYGAATLATLGVISKASTRARFDFDAEEYVFDQVIEVTGCGGPFSEGGDSGALVVDALSQRPLGLIIGGVDQRTYVSPLSPILRRFKCFLLNNEEHPLEDRRA